MSLHQTSCSLETDLKEKYQTITSENKMWCINTVAVGVSEWLEYEIVVIYLVWQSQRPDLNPIEPLWDQCMASTERLNHQNTK